MFFVLRFYCLLGYLGCIESSGGKGGEGLWKGGQFRSQCWCVGESVNVYVKCCQCVCCVVEFYCVEVFDVVLEFF